MADEQIIEAAEAPHEAPLKVAYLWGAGATQAEINYLGGNPINLLMRDDDTLGDGIATRILRGVDDERKDFLDEEYGVDIEKLISLLASSGVDTFLRLAEKLRQNYFVEIRRSLFASGVMATAPLMTALFEMHRIKKFREEAEHLSGIITTNHDGLLQVVSQRIYGQVNLGLHFNGGDVFVPANSDEIPSVLQLHGSFTWKFGTPISVVPLNENTQYTDETLWIPPAILKESKSYPFNKISALAYELLAYRCDLLRVVGSSLTQNDWHVISLIFNAQRYSRLTHGTSFLIELIMPQESGLDIRRNSSYLKGIKTIGDITEGEFAPYKECYEENRPLPDPDMNNPLLYWLKEKISHHRSKGHFGEGVLPAAMSAVVGDVQ